MNPDRGMRARCKRALHHVVVYKCAVDTERRFYILYMPSKIIQFIVSLLLLNVGTHVKLYLCNMLMQIVLSFYEDKQHVINYRRMIGMSVSRPKWLEPGKLTETELAMKQGVTRMTLSRWRAEGLPFTRKSKYIIYDQKEIQPWLRARQLESYMRLHSTLVSQFVADFTESTEQGKSVTRNLAAGIASRLEEPDVSEDQRNRVIAIINDSEADAILRLQATSFSNFARNLQISSAHFLATHSNEELIEFLETNKPIALTEETKALAKNIMLNLFRDITPEYADSIIAAANEDKRDAYPEEDTDAPREAVGR